jgi:hypothetical protein
MYTINRTTLTKVDPEYSLARGKVLDPRGLVCMFEPPNSRASYVMGIDPTVGITSWDRHYRTRDDYKTDNGAIEIIRVGSHDGSRPDVQVCEYAAPIDPEDLADIANILGRLYGGNSESGEALCVIEVYPGPGLLTFRKMFSQLGYANHWQWRYLDSATPKLTSSFGWQSTPKSVRDLWIRGTRWITRRSITLNSPYLAEELADCEADQLKMTAKAAYGAHDDRVRALLMAIWAAHDWDFQVEIDIQPLITQGPPVNWQATDISATNMYSAWEDLWDQISQEGEMAR